MSLAFFAMLFVFVGFMYADCSGGDYYIQIREACTECWKNKNETACRVCEDGVRDIKKACEDRANDIKKDDIKK